MRSLSRVSFSLLGGGGRGLILIDVAEDIIVQRSVCAGRFERIDGTSSEVSKTRS